MVLVFAVIVGTNQPFILKAEHKAPWLDGSRLNFVFHLWKGDYTAQAVTTI